MKILGVSGKKQSGKGTAANFILGVNMINYGIVRGSTNITPDGKLWVSDIFGNEEGQGILNDNYYVDAETTQWWTDNVWPFCKIYSFANPLKQLCMQIFGLTYEQCYGTNEQKNSLTALLWEDMPDIDKYHLGRTGRMTAREVLQYGGTNIFRKMYPRSWIDATIKREILIEQSELAVLDDVRFSDEVEDIQKNGGKVIRLLRSPSNDDVHSSENDLDPDRFDQDKFDKIIDNREMTINQQNDEVLKCLQSWGYLPS